MSCLGVPIPSCVQQPTPDMQVAREQAQQQRNSAAAARREQGRELAEAREEAAALSAQVFQLQETLRLRDSALRRLKRRLEGAGLPGSVRPSEVCSLALHVMQQPAGSPDTARRSSSTAGLACCLPISAIRAGCCSKCRSAWQHEAVRKCAPWPFAGSAGCWPSWQGQGASGGWASLLSTLQTACCGGKMLSLPGQGLRDEERNCTAWGGGRLGSLPHGVIALHESKRCWQFCCNHPTGLACCLQFRLPRQGRAVLASA